MQAIRQVISYIKSHKIVFLIILFGSIVNLSFFFPIIGNMGHDVFWHLALAAVAFKTFPFQMPVFAGANLQGYNYLLDLLMFAITKLGLSHVYVFFVVMPLIYIVCLSLLAVCFGIKYNKSIFFVGPLVFFTFFGSPFSYILSFMHRGNPFFGFNYPTAMQSVTALTNQQHAFTLLIFFLVLIIFIRKNLSYKSKILLGVLLFFSLGFKFYAGIVLMFLLFIFEFFSLIKKKRFWRFFFSNLIYIAFILLSLLIFYDPINSNKTGGIFGFAPLSIVHPLIEDPDSFYLPKLVLARYYLYAHNIFSPRLWGIELFTLLLYIVYNSGTRIVGIIYIVKQIIRKKITRFEAAVLLTIIFSALLSFLLVQKGQWWNTVQFFGYSLFLLNIFAAKFIYDLFQSKKKAAVFITILIVLLTLPLSIELLIKTRNRIGTPNEIIKEERDALSFLKNQKDGVVFTLPVYNETSYVPAFAYKQVFFADEHLLGNLGINYEGRKKSLENLNQFNVDKIDVKYFYLLKDDKDYSIMLEKLENNQKYKKIYENQKVSIFIR